MTADGLTAAADAAFERGDAQQGLALLRELAATSKDPSVLHRLGVVEEQIGSTERALNAHLRCLHAAKGNPTAYLYAGAALYEQGRIAEALAVYSLGTDLDPGLLVAPSGRDIDPPTAQRWNHCQGVLRRHFSQLHRSHVADSSARLAKSAWVQTHDAPLPAPQSGQRPYLFYIPDLDTQPWHQADTQPWANLLAGSTDKIIAEFDTALPAILHQGRPYLDASAATPAGMEPLSGSLNWTALDLYRDGLRTGLADAFPQTLECLDAAPLYGLADAPHEVFFSLLKPGQHITPHFGLSNHSLTVHLPLTIPPDCSLTVGGESRQWEVGKLAIFDDSFLHDAINRSEQERVVLIFSIWHPDLTDAERHAIRSSFQARQDWLDQRALPPCP